MTQTVKINTFAGLPVEIELRKDRYYDIKETLKFTDDTDMDINFEEFPSIETTQEIKENQVPIIHIEDQELPNRERLTCENILAPFNRKATYNVMGEHYNLDVPGTPPSIDENHVASNFNGENFIRLHDEGLDPRIPYIVDENNYEFITKVHWQGTDVWDGRESWLLRTRDDRDIAFFEGRLGIHRDGWFLGETCFPDVFENGGEGIYWIKAVFDKENDETLSVYWMRDDEEELTLEEARTSEDWNFEVSRDWCNPFRMHWSTLSTNDWVFWKGSIYLTDTAIFDSTGNRVWIAYGEVPVKFTGCLELNTFDSENEITYNVFYNRSSKKIRLNSELERKEGFSWIGQLTVPAHTVVELPEQILYEIVGNPTIQTEDIRFLNYNLSGDYYFWENRPQHFRPTGRGRCELPLSNVPEQIESGIYIERIHIREPWNNICLFANDKFHLYTADERMQIVLYSNDKGLTDGNDYTQWLEPNWDESPRVESDRFYWVRIECVNNHLKVYLIMDHGREYTLDDLPDLEHWGVCYDQDIDINIFDSDRFVIGVQPPHRDHGYDNVYEIDTIDFKMNGQSVYELYATESVKTLTNCHAKENYIKLNTEDWDFVNDDSWIMHLTFTTPSDGDWGDECNCLIGNNDDARNMRIDIRDWRIQWYMPYETEGWWWENTGGPRLAYNTSYDMLVYRRDRSLSIHIKPHNANNFDGLSDFGGRTGDEFRVFLCDTLGWSHCCWRNEDDVLNRCFAHDEPVLGTSYEDRLDNHGKLWLKTIKVYENGDLIYEPFEKL